MNISNLRPDTTNHFIEMALRELHIVQEINDVQQQQGETETVEPLNNTEGVLRPIRRISVDDRALMPRVSSLENSFVEHLNSSIPSLDEIVIRQRGRRKQPAKISWSPIKSPFKTPTKKSSTLHMSLLSPSPAKKLFGNGNNGSPMVLRNSPRKRILTDTPNNDQDFGASTSSSSLVSSTPTKRLKFSDEISMNASNKSIPLRTLLKPMSQSQLIDIINAIASSDPEIEQKIRQQLPVPEMAPFEKELCTLRKSVTTSTPRSRLLVQSKTDSSAFSRASTHLVTFKKSIVSNSKLLQDSQAYDALIDYIILAWAYVRSLPTYDEPQHNTIRKDCFKLLTLSARHALKYGGVKIGTDRINNLRSKLKTMANDFEEIEKCRELLPLTHNDTL